MLVVMVLVGMAILFVCGMVMFSGVLHAIGSVVIALFKYVVAPVALLILALAVIKYGF